MSATLTQEARPSDDRIIEQRFEMFQSAANTYDATAPEASHLRAHQVEALRAFCDTLGSLGIDDFAEGSGIGMIMPTGSGKTVMAAEIMRLLKEGSAEFLGDSDHTLRSLLLMPRHSISNQTLGKGEEESRGIQRFAPDLTLTKCTDSPPTDPHDAHLGLYQGLTGLTNSGYLRRLDPTAVICDEMHHIIDGKWARRVTDLAPGRLLVGLTATPEYGPGRDIFDIFPHTAIRRRMVDGIEAGYLADLEGHLYMGTTRIRAGRTRGGDFNEKDLFEALIQSEDNYLAAKICAMEVAKGRKGVLFAVPGFDRAHSKLMAKIISSMEVETPQGRRKIIAQHVDGDMSEAEFEAYNRAHREGEIDILCNVDLLLEGWDNPAAEFAMLMRPTGSKVMAEQRLGRILRFIEEKTATVHELIYTFEDGTTEQITHLDILDREKVVEGKSLRPVQQKRPATKPHKFDPDKFQIDPELLRRAEELEAVPIDEIKISCGQKLVPYDWASVHQLALRFNKTVEDIESSLRGLGVLSRTETSGKIEHTYYPPRSNDMLIELFGIPVADGACPTMTELYTITQKSPVHRSLSRVGLRRVLKEAGLEPTVMVNSEGKVVHGYPAEALLMFAPPKVEHRRPRSSNANPKPKPKVDASGNRVRAPKTATRGSTVRRPRPKAVEPEKSARNEIPADVKELKDVAAWMESILEPVNLASLALREEKRIRYARESLASTLRTSAFIEVPPEFKAVAAKLKVKLSDEAQALLKAQKLDLATVLFFAQRAQRVTNLAVKKGSF